MIRKWTGMFGAYILCFVVSLVLYGCDQLKGPKGDTGSSGFVGVKVYTGTPTTNPFAIDCPEIADTSRQIIDVYVSSGTSLFKMPTAYSGKFVYEGYDCHTTVFHNYSLDGTKISFESHTELVNTVALSAALMDPDKTQHDYRVEIKTFSSSAAAMAYKQSAHLDKSRYDELVYGKEFRH